MLLKGCAKIIAVWLVSTLMMMALKPVFLLTYLDLINPQEGFWKALFEIWIHGFRIDSTIGAYISIIPAIITVVGLIPFRQMSVGGQVHNLIVKIEKIYFMVIAVLLGIIFSVDLVLYGYWGFRLDMTPLFYFTSSPASAFASATATDYLLGIIFMAILSYLIYLIYSLTIIKIKIYPSEGKLRYACPAIVLVFSALLIIPLRGGVTVSTTNLSSAYFSSNPSLNQAAVNPAFSLIYSLVNQKDYGSQFRYLDENDASRIFKEMHTLTSVADSVSSENRIVSLKTDRPDIYIIILESFSSHLFPSFGGEEVAMKLDSIASENVMFTNFYANGFRTDRGIPAILSGFPAQPTTSVMKSVDKAAHLPSIASSLKKAGYEAEYYYGGDADFTNMKAYLVNTGFSKIVSDADFSIKERLSKWGAHDDVLLRKVMESVSSSQAKNPMLRVIQTSSSHEPFEVPYSNPRLKGNPKQNAFAFTDSCVADFIGKLSRKGNWDNALVVLVPDHYGAWPENLDSLPERHKIPFILAGGAITVPGNDGMKRGMRINVVGSQTDIAATLLSLMGLGHREFEFSKNMLDNSIPHFAFLAGRNEIGLIDEKNCVSYNIEGDKIVIDKGENVESREKTLKQLKAYIQTIYDRLADL